MGPQENDMTMWEPSSIQKQKYGKSISVPRVSNCYNKEIEENSEKEKNTRTNWERSSQRDIIKFVETN